jgi:hypothetical protein
MTALTTLNRVSEPFQTLHLGEKIMRKTLAVFCVLMLTGCVGYDTPEQLKASVYHRQVIVDGNYQDIFRCYDVKERVRGRPVTGQIYSESGLAVMDYLLKLVTGFSVPGADGWDGRTELRKIDATHTKVDVWQGSEREVSNVIGVIQSCAAS